MSLRQPAARRARRAAAAMLAGVLVATLGQAAPTAGQPPATHTDASHPAVPPDVVGLDGGSHEVALVTGDRVRVNAVPGGGYDVTVDPATRPDGSTPTVEVTATDDNLYALPSDALAYVDAGVLDRELFNVGKLVEYGYHDATPVIMTADSGARPPRVAPAGATVTRQLASIDAVAVTIDSGDAWWELLGTEPASSDPGELAGIERVWLDEVAEVVLDDSVPQVGAPQAWQAGFDGSGTTVAVLDTGIDADHPDLAGKVQDAQNFTADEDAGDEHGHGTHVAGTVAGTGAASSGGYTGVAPGADLLNAKVCDAAGDCLQSAIIDGMQWAADQGADVANLSIGGEPTDGTDPLSQAVDALTEQHDLLFVVAAGNAGPNRFTVAAPGAADAALTVGAVDKSGAMAGFSGRGPRVGDHALKPEITAPGVEITAPRADGTDMGDPVDGSYTAASGTSMATPHVAGGAAILAQQQPQWSADELKAGLVGSAADGGHTVYEQGAGLLDLARAVDQRVRMGAATADFGRLPWPQEGPPQTRTLTYHNPHDDAVTLELDVSAATVDGDPLPDGVLTLDAETLAVPAGGTASATLALDHTAADSGLYTGRVAATGPDGLRLGAPVGFHIRAPQYTLEVTVPERESVDEFQNINVSLYGVDGALASESTDVNCLPGCPETIEFTVPAGTYSVRAWVRWLDADQQTHFGVVIDPEVVVTGDSGIVLDPNDADQITFDTPRPSEPQTASPFSVFRATADGSHRLISMLVSQDATNWWVAGTDEVTEGEFWTASHWLLTPEHEGGNPPYFYQIKLYEDGRLPDDSRYRLRDGELAVADHHFHAEDDGTPVSITFNARREGEFALGGFVQELTGPATVREYAWPLRDDTVHARTMPPVFFPTDSALFLFDEPAHRDVHWNARPAAPGAAALPPGFDQPREDLNIVPFPFWACVACRQGDTFYPFLHQVSSQPGHLVDRFGHAEEAFGQHFFLFRDGELLEPAEPLIGAFTAYDMPEEPADYRLVLDDQNNDSVTEWRFSSQAPAEDATPPGYWCLATLWEDSSAPCQAAPLIFLGYDAGVDIRNTVAAPGAHQLEVTIDRQADGAPAVDGIDLWFSTDDGAGWTPARGVRPAGDGRYIATIVLPPADRTSGSVSLRAHAWDEAGNRVEQTIIGAYGMRDRSAS